MTGLGKLSGVSLDGRGRPIVSVYLAFPWWVSGGARGTSQAWPCGILGVSSISQLSDLSVVTYEYELMDIDVVVIERASEF